MFHQVRIFNFAAKTPPSSFINSILNHKLITYAYSPVFTMKPFRTTPRPEDIDDDNAPQLPGEGLINHRILTGRFPDDKYPYISRRATEVDGLEGMTPEKLFNVLVLNSRLSESKATVNYDEWYEKLGTGEDPRTCFDFLFNRDSEIVWRKRGITH
ncbi:hypothetical protein ACMFMG_008269 [Clarireedia jacksonii]